jgi:uncharacterized membrane protein
MTHLPLIILVCGFVILSVSLPLIFRKVPMNPYYGFRVAASYASPERWYSINEYSGRLLAKWSTLPILTGLLGFFLSEEWFVAYSSVAVLALLCTAAVPSVFTLRWIRKTSAPNDTSTSERNIK